ncbi:class I SAM-dependent methyltransferase [Brasilonema bromeliae]|uniref:Methyltransferase n=1 Tax=Brasilonema bromeliae SPC951 TaxID=385972 RepID=A0ABX1PAY6_9CYAN|nr:methyltransferase domain-containing protein [Brasilonema bromeliae]NMG21629.1 methyltransferase [Brasilonema bromeliae SPC951]
MAKQLKLNDYKQQIADVYNRRSHNYDESEWHLRIAHRLVEYAQISPGYDVLDIATGTGHVAIEVAQRVGSSGRVVGVDISTEMLTLARRKVEALSLSNVELQFADAEALNFPVNSFDRILCANAFPLMTDMEAALRQWMQFLKPNGLVGFHALADTALVGVVIWQKVFENYGVSRELSEPTGTVEKCHNLLERAGFEAIEIKTEQYGSYISLEEAKQRWTISSYPAPKFSNTLFQLSPEQLEEIKAEFDAQLQALVTEHGIWNDGTCFFVFGRKGANSITHQ